MNFILDRLKGCDGDIKKEVAGDWAVVMKNESDGRGGWLCYITVSWS